MAGLSSQEACIRLEKYGPNAISEDPPRFFLTFLKKFWAPVPWMLEGIVLLELGLKKPVEAGIIFVLLLFNAILGFLQEKKAKKAVHLLKNQLPIFARVMRDGNWQALLAQELVPGDYLRIRMGDIIPADVKILDGLLLVDQSVLTGESLPVEVGAGGLSYAGATVSRGEAFVEVVATGIHSFYGKTAEIIRLAKAPSLSEKTIFQIISYLIAFDIVLVVLVFIGAIYFQLPLLDLIPFSLLLLVAAVPVALPTTFTLATALGSLKLVKSGVLVTRLSAIEDAASMTILCIDKTGTITQNVLSISAICSYPPYCEDDVLMFAALASEESTQDAIDLAVIRAAKKITPSLQRLEFIPFDPQQKYSAALVSDSKKKMLIKKGAPNILFKEQFAEDVHTFGIDGSRVLAITVDGSAVGLLKLQDPLREDSIETLQEIQKLGIRIIMLTGDAASTAQAIAMATGIGSRIITREHIDDVINADAVAGIFPEDKFRIIQILQKANYVCGMTGDGVNDAPALQVAEMGVAVASAVDVAKASASVILTTPGLHNIVRAIKISRKIYQRMQTYTLNKIIKTLEISVLLSIGLLIEKKFIISQLLIVFLLFVNDFVAMSIATDRVSYSKRPDYWDIKKMMRMGGVLSLWILIFCFCALWVGSRFSTLADLQTWVFLVLVFTAQGIIYLVRQRGHFWETRPSFWLFLSSVLTISTVSACAILGLFMAPLQPVFVFGLLASVGGYFFFLDFFKVFYLKHFQSHSR